MLISVKLVGLQHTTQPARWVTDAGRRTIATASITESVLPMAQRKRERVPPGA